MSNLFGSFVKARALRGVQLSVRFALDTFFYRIYFGYLTELIRLQPKKNRTSSEEVPKKHRTISEFGRSLNIKKSRALH
ncbi:MAG: hypothetical protein ACN6PI_03085, partial [Sphingobacterium siyangense]